MYDTIDYVTLLAAVCFLALCWLLCNAKYRAKHKYEAYMRAEGFRTPRIRHASRRKTG